jgi:hypothetical protein
VDNAKAVDLRALDNLANCVAQVTGRRVVHQAGRAFARGCVSSRLEHRFQGSNMNHINTA